MTNLSPIDKIVAAFFKKYEKATNTFDGNIISAAYTKDFISADPNNIYPTKNNAEFRQAAPARKKQFTALGFEKSQIVSLTHSPISDEYVKAKVKWRMTFKKDGKPLVATFFITYILFIQDGKAQIPFYISHDSEEKMMKELGII